MLYTAGDIIRFTYISSSTNKFKEAFVIHNNWQGKVHAIDMKLLTVAEREVLKTVMDPKAKGKTHRFPLINDILTRMDPSTLIENPVGFYNQLIKPFIRNKNVYRTYFPQKMTGIQIIDAKDVQAPSTGFKPLFGG